MPKIPIVSCTTCGKEGTKTVPRLPELEAEMQQLKNQEATLTRLLEKCRTRQHETRRAILHLKKK